MPDLPPEITPGVTLSCTPDLPPEVTSGVTLSFAPAAPAEITPGITLGSAPGTLSEEGAWKSGLLAQQSLVLRPHVWQHVHYLPTRLQVRH